MKRNSKIYKTALFGILSALALALSLFENVFVPDIAFLPAGAKPGLSNIITMITAELFGFGGAIYITLIKAVFALITRGVTAFFMSFCGGLLSTALLCVLIKFQGKNLSFIGIGVLCAVMHNLGQLLCACVISGTAQMLALGKYLLIFAVISGTLTGAFVNVVLPAVKKVLPDDY